MNAKKILSLSLGFFGMGVLILDARTALEGAKAGLQLCLQSLIPSLFPFFVLSIMLTGSLSGMDVPLLRPLGKLFRLTRGTESLLLCGLLGGYPVGAKLTAQAWERGSLSRADAQRLLTFCSQPGPSFLFGIVAGQFPKVWMAWLLWGIQLLGAILVSRLLPGEAKKHTPSPGQAPVSVLTAAIQAMANVCGWVILFRMVMAFLERWFLWAIPREGQVGLCGLLELSNGCVLLGQMQNLRHRFLIAAGMLSCGGLCVAMQTVSVIGGLSIRPYLLGKLLQTVFCTLLAGSVVYGSFYPLLLLAVIFWGSRRILQKRDSNPAAVAV